MVNDELKLSSTPLRQETTWLINWLIDWLIELQAVIYELNKMHGVYISKAFNQSFI